ncbi:MAG: phosphoenolpyruvate--protein phosphotransferase [Tissierellia bacterium]|nr:phosphoenolpyruvate--protein phosphotransferase [Tissierellia bacterium]
MKGLGVSQGIGIGKAFIIEKKVVNISVNQTDDTDNEVRRFHNALENCKKETEELYIKTLNNIGEKEAMIFKSHEMILEDEVFISDVETKIKNEKVNAEFAVNEIAISYIKMFESINDEYLRERADDVKDIMNRVLSELMGINTIDFSKMEKDSVLVVKDLTPSDTAQLDRTKVSAMITEIGGKTSHAAIMARILGIPTVVGLEGIVDNVKSDDIIICDGKSGKVIINPSEKQKQYYSNKRKKELNIIKQLKKQIGLPTVTKDGFTVNLSSNISSPRDVDSALENDAEGIGLFRSEFLFMNRNCQPTEEEQFNEYKEVLVKMKEKPVIIRTMDIGGDKEVSYMDIPKEMNPFLGYRAIRVCLVDTDMFKTQLKAILRASVYGNAKIMFPMISTVQELKDAKKIYEQAKDELRQKKIPFKDNIEIGIMIEIPSAAIISDILAKEVDFFSIGTNDLIQYTMAVDRMNSKLAHLYSQYHPALLRLIKSIITNAHNAGIWVGMCGEAAGDPKLIPVFVGMGLDEFSMNSPSILRARYIIRDLNKKEMDKIADDVINIETAMEVEKYLSCIFSESEIESRLCGNMKYNY